MSATAAAATLTPFKNYYGIELTRLLAEKITSVHPAFPSAPYIAYVAAGIDPLELKARVALQRDALRQFLPPDYPAALDILLGILGDPLTSDEGMFSQGYWIMPIAAFVQEYGLDHFDLSMRALYEITQRFSSEEAVRPYILRYPDQTLALLRGWITDPNPHVRRWISEGIRPRLPWAIRLQPFIQDPSPVLEMLEYLKDDPSLYVRKSVANNLNDVAKDHPELVVRRLEDWTQNASDGTAWIIRHALRTQIKRGDPAALALLGYTASDVVTVESFTVTPTTIAIGGTAVISLTVTNNGGDPHDAVIDYVVHFVKVTGKTSPKVFKWTTVRLSAGERLSLEKRHAFRDVSIRKHYPGVHRIEVQINGQILAAAEFTLTPP